MSASKFTSRFVRGLRLLGPPLGLALLVGVLTGLLGASFYRLVGWASRAFDGSPQLVVLLPAAGLLIAFLYRSAGPVGDTNDVLRAIQEKQPLSRWMAPLIYICTVITRLFGGSVGTEGAAIQIGAGTADFLGRTFRLQPEQIRVLLMSGISGGFAAIVGTPVTAVLLALELAGVGIMYYAALLPCAAASAVSFGIARAFGTAFPGFHLGSVPGITGLSIAEAALLAAMCGLVSILQCSALRYAAKGYSRLVPNPLWRAAFGGVLIAAATWLAGSTAYNGDGLPLLRQAASGGGQAQTFLLKMLFTALTLGAGFKGGAIVPTLVTGAAFGGWMGPLLGLPGPLSAGIGMTAVFCGAINCPVTSFVLGMEVFGTEGSLYLLLACAVSYVCSGPSTLYPAQILWQPKVGRPEGSLPYR
ncbi:MAG: chloride channel protein [Clostridia bacterium]|nr:chloride channel protein [Clostridia bacterium]